MTGRRSLRKARRVKRHSRVPSINLVSMIDIFTILIIYLLVNTAAVQVIGAEQVDLPTSVAQEEPRQKVAVIISNQDILVDGRPLMSVAAAKAAPGVLLEPLRATLLERAASDAARHAVKGPEPEGGEVNILADKKIPYSLLKRVMVTCSAAQFINISLGVIPAGRGRR